MKFLTGLLYGALLLADVSAKKLTTSQAEGDIKKEK